MEWFAESAPLMKEIFGPLFFFGCARTLRPATPVLTRAQCHRLERMGRRRDRAQRTPPLAPRGPRDNNKGRLPLCAPAATAGLQALDTTAKNVLGDWGGKWGDGSRVQTPSKRSVNKTNTKTNAKLRLSPAGYEELRQMNLLDIELFEYAKQHCKCQAATWLFKEF